MNPHPNPLEAAQLARQARQAAGLKTTKSPLEKLAENPKSLRLAINGRCYQCMGEHYDPGVRKRIGTCNSEHCALHAVRPYQGIAANDDPEEMEEEAA